MSSCPPVKDLVEAIENDDFSADLLDHAELCGACSSILSSLRDESEGLTISVGSLWVKERISCPHQDILLAFVNGALSAEEQEYLEFHLNVVDCPSCQSAVEEIKDLVDRKAPERLKRAMDESMRRSAAFLDKKRD